MKIKKVLMNKQKKIMLTTILQLFTELVVSGMLIVAVFIMAPEITIIMAVILLLLTIIINRILSAINDGEVLEVMQVEY